MGKNKDKAIFKLFSIAVLVVGVLLAFSSPTWATACIEVDKRCDDANAPGEPILFDGYIRNCGNLPLTIVTAEDSITGPLELDTWTLAVDQSVSFIGSYYPDSSPSTNTVTVTANYYYSNGNWAGIVFAEDSAICSVPDSIGCRVTGGGVDTAGLDLFSNG